ncbi:heparin-binding hemagglutinin [Gordonia sp. zg691]|uniref:Heparin-binding hemagglutinin n=1 Tax=Gordonia jinghuaiqii TaxID=2758710 RepID=A0A7D7LWJ7_9ACTN|nr:heparin-binding hemagglutinin [Gordonia jinghuaiqii]MBD0861635.1 heparin-binding hemagglutinin [Gordonia jinghuaiqii]MCR5977529.1 heparin-binding hemagglutinin [Gordonia jinghuaiqii]QMT02215.1 heparin-binding hemagglutinin [Gordonia jinghuaiqii]
MTTTERNYAPLYAAVGAGDYAFTQVTEKLTELRERTEAAAETAQSRLEARYSETKTLLNELPETAQSRIGEAKTRIESLSEEVPGDLEELRGKLTADELKRLADPYVEKAYGFYTSLAERGEATLDRLRTKPVVQENLTRAEKVYNDAVDLTEDALGVVSTQTRLVGDRAAKLAGRVSEEVEDVAVAIEEAGGVVKEQANDAAKELDGAAGTVEAKGRAAKASPANKVAEAKTTPVPPVKKTTAKKAPAKKAPAKKPTTAK